MRKVLNIIALFAYCLLLYSLTASTSLAEELIPPSRTLQDAKEAYGKLTVVSEPPGLNVFLDGSKIGQTPIWLRKVKPGPHKLRVKHSETDIHVEANTTLQISFFKGSFTAKAEKEEKKQASPEKERPAEETGLVTDPGFCKYGYYEDPAKPGFYRCYYDGWGTHICETNTGLKECVVRGNSPYSCEDLAQALRATDCCQENFGGFSTSFSLNQCETY
jgi:hypothetical protein